MARKKVKRTAYNRDQDQYQNALIVKMAHKKKAHSKDKKEVAVGKKEDASPKHREAEAKGMKKTMKGNC